MYDKIGSGCRGGEGHALFESLRAPPGAYFIGQVSHYIICENMMKDMVFVEIFGILPKWDLFVIGIGNFVCN